MSLNIILLLKQLFRKKQKENKNGFTGHPYYRIQSSSLLSSSIGGSISPNPL
jgi:hypothetical protein